MPTEKQLANLKKGKRTQFRSGEEAAIKGRKGGKASGKERAFTKDFKQTLSECLDDDKRLEIAQRIVDMAARGNLKAFELIRDTVGEKPIDKVNIDSDLGLNISVDYGDE